MHYRVPMDNKMSAEVDLMAIHCIGESNVTYDMLIFNRCDQEKHESCERISQRSEGWGDGNGTLALWNRLWNSK